MMNLSIGGRYCSITTVESGNAFVFDLKIEKIATAGQQHLCVRRTALRPKNDCILPSTPDDFLVLRSAHSQTRCLHVNYIIMKELKINKYLLPLCIRILNFFQCDPPVILVLKKSVCLDQEDQSLRLIRWQNRCRYNFGKCHSLQVAYTYIWDWFFESRANG